MKLQTDIKNDLFNGLGIEFHHEAFTTDVVNIAANEIRDFYKLKNVSQSQKLKMKTLALLYFKQHHLLSLIKKPNLLHTFLLLMVSKINGLKL